MLSDNIKDYYVVSQGKTSIPGVDDAEELELTDVRFIEKFPNYKHFASVKRNEKFKLTVLSSFLWTTLIVLMEIFSPRHKKDFAILLIS